MGKMDACQFEYLKGWKCDGSKDLAAKTKNTYSWEYFPVALPHCSHSGQFQIFEANYMGHILSSFVLYQDFSQNSCVYIPKSTLCGVKERLQISGQLHMFLIKNSLNCDLDKIENTVGEYLWFHFSL